MPFAKQLKHALITGGVLLTALPVHAGELNAREQAARAAAGSFVQELGGALRQEMQQGGPDQAILVCRDVAPHIAGELSRANGWQVTRVGTRVRNPMLGMPDAWESEVLSGFEERAAAGEPYAEMEFGEVVEIGGAEHYRYMKAIPTQEACLTCHGAAERIPTGVKAKLESAYPHDRATGYLAGQLRGAISITQPLDIPLAASAAK
ncbi:DUF3365 domain-containing protein [Ectothiorhodospiraceae bacterium 2226]|nr:DUF3365 domain-containing protein [Ectothiorhodospiraceae bacterium 2226]